MKKLITLILLMTLSTICVFSQSWQIKDNRDEFGDVTGGKYGVCRNDSGSFTNSATFNGDLTVIIFYKKDCIYLTFWEYDRNKAYFGRDLKFGTLLIKDNSGTIHKIGVEQFKSVLYIKKSEIELFVKLMYDNTQYLRCYYREVSDYSNSSYKFRLNTKEFKTINETLN